MSASSEVHEGIKIAAVALAVTVSFGLLTFASGARAQGTSAEQDIACTLITPHAAAKRGCRPRCLGQLARGDRFVGARRTVVGSVNYSF